MSDDKETKSVPPEIQQYAWNWLSYHAGQRLVAFRFFLIFLGIILVGYYKSFSDGNFAFSIIVSLFGAFISLAFFFLEIRNEKLVIIGRNALQAMENSGPFTEVADAFKISHVDNCRSFWLSHKFWLRAIYILCMLLFLAAFVVSVIRSSNSTQSVDVNDINARITGEAAHLIALMNC